MNTSPKSQPHFVYAKVHAAYQRLEWTNDLFGMFVKFRLQHLYDTAFKAELTLAYFNQYPRRRKLDLKQLRPEMVEMIRHKWAEIALANYAAWSSRRLMLDTLLDRLATITPIEILDISPDQWPTLKSGDTSTYCSQGYGAGHYARQSLMRYEIALSGAEIPYRIDWEPRDNPGGDQAMTPGSFSLKTPLAVWQLDCLIRAYRPTISQWAWDCWDHGVNPQVYNPFLDDKIFDETMHCRGAKNCPRPRN
jgi:hypothetical protein